MLSRKIVRSEYNIRCLFGRELFNEDSRYIILSGFLQTNQGQLKVSDILQSKNFVLLAKILLIEYFEYMYFHNN